MALNSMNLYVSLQEIKDYGLSAPDARLIMFNKMATDVVNGAVNATDLALHKLTAEPHVQAVSIDLYDHHVRDVGTILDNGYEYTQVRPYDILDSRLKLDHYTFNAPRDYYIDDMVPRPLTVTYAAGFNASGYAVVTISDQDNIAANATITLGKSVSTATDNFVITRGTDWNPGISSDTEADNIAAALNTHAGIRAFSIQNRVYVIEDSNPQASGRTIVVSDSVRLLLSSATLTGIDFPESIRLAVLVYIADLINRGKNPRLKSYSIGGKSVTFGTDAEFSQFSSLLSQFIRAGVTSI